MSKSDKTNDEKGCFPGRAKKSRNKGKQPKNTPLTIMFTKCNLFFSVLMQHKCYYKIRQYAHNGNNSYNISETYCNYLFKHLILHPKQSGVNLQS